MTAVRFPAYIELGPERIFHIDSVLGDESGAVGHLTSGPWMLDSRGGASVGSLGVLVDDVFGFGVAEATPDGFSTVTTHVHLDVLGEVPTAGERIVAEVDSMNVDPTGGVATGRVCGPDGDVVAIGSLRGRFVEGLPPSSLDEPVLPHRPVRPAGSVLDALGGNVDTVADGIDLKFAITEELVNVKDNLHGGITFCALEVAGTRAAWAVEPEGRFTTVTVDALYLRGVPLGRDLTCAARVVHSGRSITVVRVEAYVDEGKPIAVTTLMRHRCG